MSTRLSFSEAKHLVQVVSALADVAVAEELGVPTSEENAVLRQRFFARTEPLQDLSVRFPQFGSLLVSLSSPSTKDERTAAEVLWRYTRYTGLRTCPESSRIVTKRKELVEGSLSPELLPFSRKGICWTDAEISQCLEDVRKMVLFSGLRTVSSWKGFKPAPECVLLPVGQVLKSFWDQEAWPWLEQNWEEREEILARWWSQEQARVAQHRDQDPRGNPAHIPDWQQAQQAPPSYLDESWVASGLTRQA